MGVDEALDIVLFCLGLGSDNIATVVLEAQASAKDSFPAAAGKQATRHQRERNKGRNYYLSNSHGMKILQPAVFGLSFL